MKMTWLFSGGKKKQDRVEDQLAAVLSPAPSAPAITETVAAPAAVTSAPAAAPMSFSYGATSYQAANSGDDYEDFLLHMQSGKRPFRKPGITVKQEFELWLAHRAKTRQAEAAAADRGKAQARAHA
jgi:hypothetical protein